MSSGADPAAEHFNYPVSFDVRDLVTLDDVMEEMKLGPNGCALLDTMLLLWLLGLPHPEDHTCRPS
jgi:hypothetical protein